MMLLATLKQNSYTSKAVPAGIHLEFIAHAEDGKGTTVQLSIPINELVKWLRRIEDEVNVLVGKWQRQIDEMKKLENMLDEIAGNGREITEMQEGEDE